VRTVHYISLAVALAVTALIYWGGNTVAPKKAGPAAAGTDAPHVAGSEAGHVQPETPDSFLAAARRRLPAHGAEEIARAEAAVRALPDSTAMVPALEALADAWREHKQPLPTVYYRALAAGLDKSPEKLTFAGRSALAVLETPDVSPAGRLWAAQTAIALLSKAVEARPDVDTLQLALAVAYIDGTGETMQGVQQLLAITRTQPQHIPANLLLGRLAVQSGQWDKAAGRFQTVLGQEPTNVEALLGLADVYRGQGQKERAIETFNLAKQVVNNPEFSRDIDAYIATFSKPD